MSWKDESRKYCSREVFDVSLEGSSEGLPATISLFHHYLTNVQYARNKGTELPTLPATQRNINFTLFGDMGLTQNWETDYAEEK